MQRILIVGSGFAGMLAASRLHHQRFMVLCF
jgi:monoamine oxidase